MNQKSKIKRIGKQIDLLTHRIAAIVARRNDAYCRKKEKK